MKISKENIQSVFIWIGVLFFGYVLFIADAKPRQALEEIESGNAPQSIKRHYSNCKEILNDLDRVGVASYWGNYQRDTPEIPPPPNNQQKKNPNPNYYNNNYYQQAYRQAPATPQKKRTNWNPLKKIKTNNHGRINKETNTDC